MLIIIITKHLIIRISIHFTLHFEIIWSILLYLIHNTLQEVKSRHISTISHFLCSRLYLNSLNNVLKFLIIEIATFWDSTILALGTAPRIAINDINRSLPSCSTLLLHRLASLLEIWSIFGWIVKSLFNSMAIFAGSSDRYISNSEILQCVFYWILY